MPEQCWDCHTGVEGAAAPAEGEHCTEALVVAAAEPEELAEAAVVGASVGGEREAAHNTHTDSAWAPLVAVDTSRRSRSVRVEAGAERKGRRSGVDEQEARAVGGGNNCRRRAEGEVEVRPKAVGDKHILVGAGEEERHGGRHGLVVGPWGDEEEYRGEQAVVAHHILVEVEGVEEQEQLADLGSGLGIVVAAGRRAGVVGVAAGRSMSDCHNCSSP